MFRGLDLVLGAAYFLMLDRVQCEPTLDNMSVLAEINPLVGNSRATESKLLADSKAKKDNDSDSDTGKSGKTTTDEKKVVDNYEVSESTACAKCYDKSVVTPVQQQNNCECECDKDGNPKSTQDTAAEMCRQTPQCGKADECSGCGGCAEAC